jgi:hypothetical protein
MSKNWLSLRRWASDPSASPSAARGFPRGEDCVATLPPPFVYISLIMASIQNLEQTAVQQSSLTVYTIHVDSRYKNLAFRPGRIP